MNFLKLIRYQNLIFIALTQVFIKYGLFHPFGIEITLNGFGFALLVISTLCLAAAGNIINDINDVDIDRINKPSKLLIGTKISEKSAYRWFIILNVIGVAVGFYLSNLIGRAGFSALFIVISALLYLYSTYLKGILLIGNLVVSALVALSIIIVGLFDLLPTITPENQGTQSLIFSIVLDYALFAFFLNFIREIIKDLQDINGDKNGGLNTLPIAIGRKRATWIVFFLGVLAIGSVIFYMYKYLYQNQIAVLYFLFLIIAPLLYFCIKVYKSETVKEYKLLSNVLKIVMFLGMFSILVYQFSLS